jgi:phosphate/sulfate permease
MSLFGEVRSFVQRYLSNPLIAAAVAFIIASIIKKHAKKTSERVEIEGARYTHTRSGTVDVITDTETGQRAIIKGTDVQVESWDGSSERIKGLHEKWFKEQERKDWDGFPMDEFHKGIGVEFEHTKDPFKAATIAIDHLKEDPEYYTKLKSAGL